MSIAEETLHLEIVQEAINSVPESWRAFSLRLTYQELSEDSEGLAHEFVSASADPAELPQPTDRLYEVTWELFTLHRQSHKIVWDIADYAIARLENGDWHFAVEFSYSD